MAEKKSTRKSKTLTRRPRNPEGVSTVWGGAESPSPRKNRDGEMKASAAPPKRNTQGVLLELVAASSISPRPNGKRNPAPLSEEIEDERKARELTLVAWKHLYAKRERFGKTGRG